MKDKKHWVIQSKTKRYEILGISKPFGDVILRHVR